METEAEATRQAELFKTQRLLRAVGATERPSQRNLAHDALYRLSVREKAIGNVNEILAALGAVVRGITDFFTQAERRPRHRE